MFFYEKIGKILNSKSNASFVRNFYNFHFFHQNLYIFFKHKEGDVN